MTGHCMRAARDDLRSGPGGRGPSIDDKVKEGTTMERIGRRDLLIGAGAGTVALATL